MDHLQVLKYVLWKNETEESQVSAVLATLPQGPVRQAIAVIDDALVKVSHRPTDPDQYGDG